MYGNLINILTILKGLPLAYNKDMQEDKELIFDSIDTIKNCINIFIEMLSTMKINKERMRDDALSGFINATDLADYLVNKGMAFRDAYKLSGEIVNFCIKENNKLNKKDGGFKFTLENLDINTYKRFSKLFSEDVYDFINLDNCVKRRNSYGGTSQSNIDVQIKYLNK